MMPKEILFFRNHTLINKLHKHLKHKFNHHTEIDSTYDTLSYLIMTQKSNESYFFYPFLNSLPKNFDEYIYLYNNEELEILENSMILDFKKTYNDNSIILKTFEIFQREFKDAKKLTFKEYLKAYISVESRLFAINYSNYTDDVMVPISDLFNHNSNKNADWRFIDKTKHFEIFAVKDIAKGEEVFLNYGITGNSYSLLYYGFTINKNFTDFEITLNVKDDLIITHNLDLNLKLSFMGGRVLQSLTNYRKLANGLKNTSKSLNFLSPISVENELKALNIIKVVIKKKLRRYKTTVQVYFI